MENFRPLNEEEYERVWYKFRDLFDFAPDTTVFPAIKTTSVHLKFDIKNCVSPDFPMNQLEDFAISLFKSISKPGDRFYALDWQHECYDFDPRIQMDRHETGEWMVPIFPNGDYYIFLTKDFKNVWFGHPWEETITLIGEEIVGHAQSLGTDVFEF